MKRVLLNLTVGLVGIVLMFIPIAIFLLVSGRVHLHEQKLPQVAPAYVDPMDDPSKFSNSLLLKALNNYRVSMGDKPLSENSALDGTAYAHALDMQTRHYYAHTTPDGVTAYQRINSAVADISSGENEDALCSSDTVNMEMGRFENSPEHNENMLFSKYTDVGIGWVPSSRSPCNGYLVYDFAQL